MPPLLYISALICTLVVVCLAEVVSLRSAPSRIQALAERPKIPTEYLSPPFTGNTNPDLTNDLDLLDIVLVASVDGKFHALNRSSGNILWSMSSFATSTSISAPSALGPLVRTNHADHDPELTDDTSQQELYIIEPQSGDIYVMATPTSPLQRFPFSMAELVDMSPFTFSGDEGRRVFVGRKETSLLLIELETGKVKATLNSECPWDPFEDNHDEDAELDLDELEGSKPPMSTPTEVFIGRTDYHISIYTQLSRNPALPRPPVQNLSFSTYGPNNKDNHLQASYRRTKDDAYIQSLPNGEIISFKAKSKGDIVSNTDSHLLWGNKFNTPVVAIFDVLQKLPSPSHPHSSQHPFVLLQPRPRLQDVLPSLTSETTSARLPNFDSAYVGMVEETGSLFAMSPTRFPLVVFGGPEHAQGRLLDGPSRPSAGLANEVDAITKARKQREKELVRERERCHQDPMGDRRCLIGVRKLEDEDGPESRMKRLLDGAPGGGLSLLPRPGGDLQQPVETPQGVGGTLGSVSGVGSAGDSNSSGTVGATPQWGIEGGNVWSAVSIVIILGAVSLWLGLKKLKPDEKGPSPQAGGGTAVEVSSMVENTQPIPLFTPPTPAINLESVSGLPPLRPEETSDTILQNSEQVDGAAADDGEESGGDGEAEGDVSAVRKGTRRKRGKKKKKGIALPAGEDGEEEKRPASGRLGGHSPDPEIEPVPSPPPSLVITSSSKPVVASPSLVVSDTILGFGSHGTVVFQGSLQGRAVAVKRLLQDFVTLASREVSILQESDDHPNVIRYYYQEAHANFLYIALELCPASLADIVEYPDRDQWRDIAISFDPKKALRQITSGLRHLHALKLVHRDIKPQNILVTNAKGTGGRAAYRMLISDFGLCKKLDVDQTSFLPTAHGAMAAGTVGWRAPEILRGEVKLDEIGDDHSMSSRGSTGTVTGSPSMNGNPTRLTKSVDIFALGCLFYYTLTNGGHPFGDRFEREVNILKDAKHLEGLERFGEEGAEAADLIEKMLKPQASLRPDTTTCLLHPFFWDSGRRLHFLQDASDRFEIMCRDPKDPLLLTLEKDAFDIVGSDWHSRLDKIFIENLGKFRKYDGRSVQDLLRALRNKKHHYQDLPDNVKRHLGPMPEGFLSYFTRRYPSLFLHVHRVIGSTPLHSESMFKSYFELPD